MIIRLTAVLLLSVSCVTLAADTFYDQAEKAFVSAESFNPDGFTGKELELDLNCITSREPKEFEYKSSMKVKVIDDPVLGVYTSLAHILAYATNRWNLTLQQDGDWKEIGEQSVSSITLRQGTYKTTKTFLIFQVTVAGNPVFKRYCWTGPFTL